MLNLLGDLWFVEGERHGREPRWADVLALPGAHLHLYGKTDARRGRKMGHLEHHRRTTATAVRSTADFAAAAAGPADPAVRMTRARMIRDGQSPGAIAAAADACCARAAWSPCRPRPSTAWAPTRAATRRWPASSGPRAGPADHPLIVHVAAGAKGTEALSHFAQPLPPFAQKLVRAFWPGPLTLIVPRQPGVRRGRRRRAGHHRPALPGASGGAGAAARPAPSWACSAWPGPAPTASAASARPPRSTCRTSSATSCWCVDGGAVRGGHRIDHRRLQPRRPGAAAARRRSRARRSRPPAASRCGDSERARRARPARLRARSRRTTRRTPRCG